MSVSDLLIGETLKLHRPFQNKLFSSPSPPLRWLSLGLSMIAQRFLLTFLMSSVTVVMWRLYCFQIPPSYQTLKWVWCISYGRHDRCTCSSVLGFTNAQMQGCSWLIVGWKWTSHALKVRRGMQICYFPNESVRPGGSTVLVLQKMSRWDGSGCRRAAIVGLLWRTQVSTPLCYGCRQVSVGRDVVSCVLHQKSNLRPDFGCQFTLLMVYDPTRNTYAYTDGGNDSFLHTVGINSLLYHHGFWWHWEPSKSRQGAQYAELVASIKHIQLHLYFQYPCHFGNGPIDVIIIVLQLVSQGKRAVVQGRAVV